MKVFPESPLPSESSPLPGSPQSPQQFIPPKGFNAAGRRSSLQSNASSGNKAKLLKNRASELIIQVPVRQLRRIARTEGIGSLQRETQHFVGVTSINGLLRIYRSRGFIRFFWVLVTILSLALLLWQIAKLCIVYNSKPTVSQVSFLLPENGLQFPAITICSHNPVRKEYVQRLNASGHFSQNLLDYAMHSFMEPQYLLTYKDPDKLKLVDEEWKHFVKNSKTNFTINSFFWNASTSCQQMLKYCSFGGRQFDCCLYAKGILTDIGKCYQLNFDEADQSWLKHQVQAGMNNGLQIIADAHTEEQISSAAINSGHALAEIFENGFRYYVHDQNAMPYLSTEGISVSPGTKVYSAISPTNYLLLSHNEWGNCTNEWPLNLNKIETDGIGSLLTLDENLPYSLLKCKTICLAKYFYERCGCSPFIYNIEEYFTVCTPYDTYKCINDGKNITKSGETNQTDDNDDDYSIAQELPTCAECKIECHRSVYHIYNSYSHGFSQSFLSWIQKKKIEWTPGHVHSNFVAINIFFRDICYTEYKQIQSVGMTEILSDIGGNMGLFLGMSLVSVIELGTFLWKITWIFISKKRREHMIAKKCRDEEREKHLQATMEFALQQRRFAASIGRLAARHSHQQEGGAPIAKISLANPLNYSSSSSSFEYLQQQQQRKPSIFNTLFGSSKRKISSKNNFVESIISSRLHGNAGRSALKTTNYSSSEDDENEGKCLKNEKKRLGKLVELKIDLDSLDQNGRLRRKSTCAFKQRPPSSSSNLWKRRASIFEFPNKTTKINETEFPKIKEEN
ncbi:hypothetical protein ACQ4LE_004066 [Meloidogyne hapla]